MKLVKFVIYEIAVPLAHIFQRCIETGVFQKNLRKVGLYRYLNVVILVTVTIIGPLPSSIPFQKF
jgi:hypothetical protein